MTEQRRFEKFDHSDRVVICSPMSPTHGFAATVQHRSGSNSYEVKFDISGYANEVRHASSLFRICPHCQGAGTLSREGKKSDG